MEPVLLGSGHARGVRRRLVLARGLARVGGFTRVGARLTGRRRLARADVVVERRIDLVATHLLVLALRPRIDLVLGAVLWLAVGDDLLLRRCAWRVLCVGACRQQAGDQGCENLSHCGLLGWNGEAPWCHEDLLATWAMRGGFAKPL